MQRRFAVVSSLVGTLYVLAEGDVLSQLSFDSAPPDAEHAAGDALLQRATEYLQAYFAGERPSSELPLVPRGTSFQRAVWSELCRIPYGETRSYLQIAPEQALRHASNGESAVPGSVSRDSVRGPTHSNAISESSESVPGIRTFVRPDACKRLYWV